MSTTIADVQSATRGPRMSLLNRIKQNISSLAGRGFPLFFSLIVLAMIFYGWSVRDRGYINAEEGTGYALGIAGGVGMLLQLGYTMRKNVSWMRHMGKVRYWFIIHMLMGVLAPLMILFHANFSLGSLNSNVALFSMLLVVASGIVGRFIYSKIHKGLNGRHLSLNDLRSELASDRHVMQQLFAIDESLPGRLDRWRDRVMKPRSSLRQFFFLVRLPWLLFVFRMRLKRDMRKALMRLAAEQGWAAKEIRQYRRQISNSLLHYVLVLRSVAGFAFYTRLFALWHVLHIPLFTILVVASVFHIIAVHMY